jgi:hypothetical protein
MTAAEDAVRIAEACVVRPGDVLVLSVDGVVTMAEFEELVAHVRKDLPETIKMLVLGGAIHLHVLRAGEIATPDESDACRVAEEIRRKVGDEMLGELGRDGLADAIWDTWEPFHQMDAKEGEAFESAVSKELFG